MSKAKSIAVPTYTISVCSDVQIYIDQHTKPTNCIAIINKL